MNRKAKFYGIMAACLLMCFILWTAAVCLTDVKPIGPNGSCVGMSAVNLAFFRLTGVNMSLYYITDWLSILPIAVALGFGVFALLQWIRRRRFLKIDHSLLYLSLFYAAVMVVYVLFELLAVNYRPVLVEGVLEASYPSSTTILVLCVMSTALMQFKERISNIVIRKTVAILVVVYTVFMVAGRLISGVHWFTDIIGGVLISAALVAWYMFMVKREEV